MGSRLVELLVSASPWVLVALLALMLVWAYGLVWMVITKSVRRRGAATVAVKVRLFPWPRIEVDVRESG